MKRLNELYLEWYYKVVLKINRHCLVAHIDRQQGLLMFAKNVVTVCLYLMTAILALFGVGEW